MRCNIGHSKNSPIGRRSRRSSLGRSTRLVAQMRGNIAGTSVDTHRGCHIKKWGQRTRGLEQSGHGYTPILSSRPDAMLDESIQVQIRFFEESVGGVSKETDWEKGKENWVRRQPTSRHLIPLSLRVALSVRPRRSRALVVSCLVLASLVGKGSCSRLLSHNMATRSSRVPVTGLCLSSMSRPLTLHTPFSSPAVRPLMR